MSSNNIDWEKLEEYLHGNDSLPLNEDETEMVQLMRELKANPALAGAVANTDPKAAWEAFRVARMANTIPVKKMYPWKKWAVAAVTTGIIITAAVVWVQQPRHSGTITERIVSPAVEKVTLVLPDSRKIELDTAQGSIQDGIVNISFDKESATFHGQNGEAESGFNTVLVPRGKKFQLTLEDGTRVWLNADSKLTFPSKFSNQKRVVELEGEGYFEVAHAAQRPFEVSYHNQTVRVLGTRFNINAYDTREAVTLLQGSVQWSGFEQSIVLKPGQQVQTSGTKKVITRNVRAENYILWIQNTLLLENKPVKNLFDEIVRHYDVEIRYKGHISDSIKFSGAFEFPPTLNQMLSLLNSTGKVIAEQKEHYVLVEEKNR